jgi:ubiquitin-protein ligase
MSSSALQQRLLRDIAELQKEPYPYISTHINEADLTRFCLALTPVGFRALHLTFLIPDNYPLVAPQVTIESSVIHPNVFHDYICASILNTTEGWTPAYTLKSICIQLLSFFSGGTIEQVYGGKINLEEFQARVKESQARDQRTIAYRGEQTKVHKHRCWTCGFGFPRPTDRSPADQVANLSLSDKGNTAKRSKGKGTKTVNKLSELPLEILLMIVPELDTKDLLQLSKAFPEVKAALESHDCIRLRELQCFTLKKSFTESKLGVGVAILHAGKEGKFASEFEFLSREAFDNHKIRRSIQGVLFEYWLPLPISRRHWRTVKGDVNVILDTLSRRATLSKVYPEYVLYHFMNNIVVQFSQDAESVSKNSTLNHASEKAVEAYFALFHLLLCLATEKPQITRDANHMIDAFLKDATSKDKFPNLGLLLVATLISDKGLTEELTFAIIKEAILRNVVWMLDGKGAGMAELAYIEPEATSNYRLAKSFEASKTSYRLLMFLNLFYRSARKTGNLVDLCDQMFDNHGGPPPGTAERMARQIRDIREVSTFPNFLKNMGLSQIPPKEVFVNFLKRTITDSVKVGYSSRQLSQAQLYALRSLKEEGVGMSEDVRRMHDRGIMLYPPSSSAMWNLSFFPERPERNGGPQNGRRWRR